MPGRLRFRDDVGENRFRPDDGRPHAFTASPSRPRTIDFVELRYVWFEDGFRVYSTRRLCSSRTSGREIKRRTRLTRRYKKAGVDTFATLTKAH